MPSTGKATFWESITALRRQGKIPKAWNTTDLHTHLHGLFAYNSINTVPFNQSVTKDGAVQGDYIKRGREAMAYRLPDSRFELIQDPEDSR